MNGVCPPFVLLTDFGQNDPYAGQMKAALFSLAPETPILDLCHNVPPFAVSSAAFFLDASRRYYPEGSIFICVVDPGVGSDRDLFCVEGRHTLLGPDNGLLSLAWASMEQESPVRAWSLRLPEALPSATFHGRDVLVPAAAALARGERESIIGPALLHSPPLPEWTSYSLTEQGIRCCVLHVDNFGNCVLNLPLTTRAWANAVSFPCPDEEKQTDLTLESSTGELLSLVPAQNYTALPQNSVGLIAGSQGYWELACRQNSAAAFLGLSPGMFCFIHTAPQGRKTKKGSVPPSPADGPRPIK